MKVKKYLEELDGVKLQPTKPGQPSYKEISIATTDIWSNTACKGYVIKAAKQANFTDEETEKLLNELDYIFNEKTVEEAEAIYYESQF